MPERLEIVISATDRASSILNNVGVALAKQKRDLEGLNLVSDRFEALGRRQTVMALGLGAGLTALARPAAEADQAMADLNSVAHLSEEGLAGVKDKVREIASDPQTTAGVAPLAKGLRELYASGMQGKQALDVLRVSERGAEANSGDLMSATKSLSGIMKAFNETSGKDATAIMDAMTLASHRTGVGLDEIEGPLTEAASMSAAAGVSFNDLSAAFVTMTARTKDAGTSGMALQRLMGAFIHPSKELKDAMHAQGYETGVQIIQQRGLAGAVEWLTEATGGQNDQLAAMMGGLRGLRAVMALTDNGAQELAANQKLMGRSSGETGKALDEVAKGPVHQYQVALKDLGMVAEDLGTQTLPTVTKVLKEVGIGARWVQGLPAPLKGAAITGTEAGAGMLLLAGGASMAIGRVLKLTIAARDGVAALRGITTAATAAGGATEAVGAAGTAAATGIEAGAAGASGIAAGAAAAAPIVAAAAGTVLATLNVARHALDSSQPLAARLWDLANMLNPSYAGARLGADLEMGIVRSGGRAGGWLRGRLGWDAKSGTAEKVGAKQGSSGNNTGKSGSSGKNAGPQAWDDVYAAEQARAAAEAARGRGPQGAQEYRAWVQQVGYAKVSAAWDAYRRSADNRDREKFESAQLEYARDLADADQEVATQEQSDANAGAIASQTQRTRPRARRTGGVRFAGTGNSLATGFSPTLPALAGASAGSDATALPAAASQGWTRVLNLQFFVRSEEDARRVADEKIDKAFRK